MNKKFIALIAIIIIAIIGISLALSNHEPTQDAANSKTSNHITNNIHKNVNNNTSADSVIAILEGPKSAEAGTYVTIIWNVTNNKDAKITNVQGLDQNEDHNFGDINPGETKTHTFQLYIPTEEDIKEDFGDGAEITNPFYIGGFSLTYSLNGQEIQINSNPISINLI